MRYTRNSYTNSKNTVNFPSVSGDEEKLAQLEWEPGTHETLRDFPDGARSTLGYYLYLVQKGEIPPGSSSIPGIPNVFELRDEDEHAWYRLIHLKKTNDKIHVIHCFEKRSNQIEKRDIRTIEKRLSNLNERLAKERRNAKKGKQSQAARDDRKRSR
jgi:phage-related protein